MELIKEDRNEQEKQIYGENIQVYDVIESLKNLKDNESLIITKKGITKEVIHNEQ